MDILHLKAKITSYIVISLVLSVPYALCAPPCQLALDGDLNRDCKVNLDDLSWFASFWLTDWSGQPGAFLPDGIFVTTPEWGGNDSLGCGSALQPCGTVSYGVNRAINNAKSYVFVADGTYQESVTIIEGINLWGGFNPYTWVRSEPSLRNTVLIGTAAGSHAKTLIADSVTHMTTEVSGFHIKGAEPTSPGANSYAVWINDSDDDLIFKDNQIYLGRGMDGVDGADGIGGIDGPDGLGGDGASNSMGSVIAGEWIGQMGNPGTDATAGGKGGFGGGGAFGIFINNTTPTATGPSLTDNTIYPGRGGDAGDGGFGGIGVETGVGGGGGGGAGGIACGIYTRNVTSGPAYQNFNLFVGTNTGGNAGKGGKSYVNSGTDGLVGTALNYHYE